MSVDYLGDEFFEWIHAHSDADPAVLLLKYRDKMPWCQFAVLQIECRHRFAKKLHEEVMHDRFLFPTQLAGQQSSSDNLARFHSTLIKNEDRVVDLTAGLGVDAMHVAPHCCEVTAVEIDEFKSQVLKHNSAIMSCQNLRVVNADCRDFVSAQHDVKFDVGFLDPARRDDDGGRLFSLVQCRPDVLSMMSELRQTVRRLIIKMSPMLDITQVLNEVPCVTDVYVLGLSNECKEIVTVSDFEQECDSLAARIHVLSIDGVESEFCYTLSEEAAAQLCYIEPCEGDWLYEPSPTMMKAAPWRLICQRYGLKRIHPNTNLYVGKEWVADFPGTMWQVECVLPYASRIIKRFSSQWSKINVGVRNFSISSQQLRQKLRTEDRHDDAIKVIGTTIGEDKKVLLILRKP